MPSKDKVNRVERIPLLKLPAPVSATSDYNEKRRRMVSVLLMDAAWQASVISQASMLLPSWWCPVMLC